jgi:hypothetical protein
LGVKWSKPGIIISSQEFEEYEANVFTDVFEYKLQSSGRPYNK